MIMEEARWIEQSRRLTDFFIEEMQRDFFGLPDSPDSSHIVREVTTLDGGHAQRQKWQEVYNNSALEIPTQTATLGLHYVRGGPEAICGAL